MLSRSRISSEPSLSTGHAQTPSDNLPASETSRPINAAMASACVNMMGRAAMRADSHQVLTSYLTKIMEKLDYVGVMALEVFDTASGFVANEIAPRVHNSGHWTMNGARTSQFENHVRAVCGLPTASCATLAPSSSRTRANIRKPCSSPGPR